MLNYQIPDYVQDNDLVCFGISSHEINEWMPSWTPKAQKELDILSSWVQKPEDLINRPATRSDWNYTSYGNRAALRLILGIAVIRELPIKSFYARCWITYVYMIFFIGKGIGRGLRQEKPIVFYGNTFSSRQLLNYPDLFWWSLGRELPKIPPVPDVHLEWRGNQTPVYHLYHKTCYRYRLRRPRYVPWDGSQSQPIIPFFNDEGTGVINGTFRINSNTSPGLK